MMDNGYAAVYGKGKPVSKKLLISCDSPRSLLDFRGRLIEELLADYEVHIYTPQVSQTAIRQRLLALGVCIHENGLNPGNVSIWSDLKYILQLRNLLRQLKPDVFFPYTFKPVIYGVLVSRFCPVKRITPMLTGLGNNFIDHHGSRSLVQQITRFLLKLSLKPDERLNIIFQNNDDYQTLLKANILKSNVNTAVVNGSGVDLAHYKYNPPDTRQICFLMVARLINAKGIREYTEAARLIRMKYPQVRFQLAGAYDDNIDAIGADLYEEIRSGQVLEYLGLVDDIRPYISGAAVVVLPSYYGEGVPRCLLEAMAMGRAIITSNSVGCKETVSKVPGRKNGFLVPIKDIPALSAKMEHFIQHPKDILNFGLNGRNYAAQKFDVNKVNQQMLKVLSGTAAGRPIT